MPTADSHAASPVPGTGMPVPRPVRWSDDGRAVDLLDQTLLPREERILRLESADEVADAIRTLKVRGAPAIGIAGAMGLALGMAKALRELRKEGAAKAEALKKRFDGIRELLHSTRPTGRNLGWALDRMAERFRREVRDDPEAAVAGLREEADAIAREDEAMCRLIGEAGLEVLPEAGRSVLTHCNAGALATGGIGTALAPFYVALERGRAVEVLASETRPVLQGARLTAWELSRAGVRATVVPDLSTGALMKSGRVRIVMVGADRIAANGDVANKIGTYSLAVLADHHGIPFYVAAPRTTFDSSLASGEEIPIEEREEAELRGPADAPTAAPDAGVWNPAFDVTPAHLVTAFITDGGILRPPYVATIRELLGPAPDVEPGSEAGSEPDSKAASAETSPSTPPTPPEPSP